MNSYFDWTCFSPTPTTEDTLLLIFKSRVVTHRPERTNPGPSIPLSGIFINMGIKWF